MLLVRCLTLALFASVALPGALQAQVTPMLPGGAPTIPGKPSTNPPPGPGPQVPGQPPVGSPQPVQPPASQYQISLVGTWDGIIAGGYGYQERHTVQFGKDGVFDSYITAMVANPQGGAPIPYFTLRVWGQYSVNAMSQNSGYIYVQPAGSQPPEICQPGMPNLCQPVPLAPSQTSFQLNQPGQMLVQTMSSMGTLQGTLTKVQ